MNTDIQTLLRATTPEALPDVDVDALRRRGARRRAVKRTASVLTVALVLVGAAVPVVLNRQAPVRFAEQTPAGWEGLDLPQAVERLRETVRESAGSPVREIRVVGVAGRGETQPDGRTDQWMAPYDVRIRSAQESWRAVYERSEDRIAHGTGIEEVRRILAELPSPSDSPEPVDKTLQDKPADPRARPVPPTIDEAEHLATNPDPFVPGPGETERPDRAYAFMRLADALREQPLEPDVLDRAYGVLLALGEEWVEYRGLAEDLLGRRGVAFAAFDPANGTETVLVFDPDTGRAWGEIEWARAEAGPRFIGGAAVAYVE